MQTCNSGYKVAVSNAQYNRCGLGPIETCNTDPKHAVVHSQIRRQGLDTYRLVILVIKSLF